MNSLSPSHSALLKKDNANFNTLNTHVRPKGFKVWPEDDRIAAPKVFDMARQMTLYGKTQAVSKKRCWG